DTSSRVSLQGIGLTPGGWATPSIRLPTGQRRSHGAPPCQRRRCYHPAHVRARSRTTRRPSMERELWRWDAVELAAAIRSRQISSREAARSVLGRLDAVNPIINAVTVLSADQALAAADAADALVSRGE